MLPFLLINGLPTIKLIDVVDILLVSFLFYQIYKLLKGTNAIRIFIGILSIYIIWKLVTILQLHLLSEILGQFISVGVILLVVVFQPEVRRFLLLIGTKNFFGRTRRFLFWKINDIKSENLTVDPIVQACRKMASTHTGALIVLGKDNDLELIINTGEGLNANISSELLETIFFKNTPLHDGAVIITNNKVVAARCILPVSSNRNIPLGMGLRHRSAVGITEHTDSIAVVVSEQTGAISVVKEGIITAEITPAQLKNFLDEEFNEQSIKAAYSKRTK